MRILFVSETDRCRGPMARAVAERLARKENVDTSVFDSAGVAVTTPDTPDVSAVTFLRGEKINIAAHRSKPLTLQLVDGADVILCMTRAITQRAKEIAGPEFAPKIILLNEGVDLKSKVMDIEAPTADSVQAFRRVYAALTAIAGRLIRTLEEPGATPEYFKVKNVPKKFNVKAAGPRASEATIDPEKRLFLSNALFDFLERAFEPPTSAVLQEALAKSGHEISSLEVEELLKNDLHNYVRLDRDGAWHVIPGADKKRRDDAKAQAKARASAEKAKEEQARARAAAAEAKNEELTADEAYEVLGVKPSAVFDEAQKKYRALLQRYHPDKFHDDDEFRDMAEQKARRINAAWQMVKDKFIVDEEIV